jgi:hypothetical protein
MPLTFFNYEWNCRYEEEMIYSLIQFVGVLCIIVGVLFVWIVVFGIIVGTLSVFYPELDARKPVPKICILVIAAGITALLFYAASA